MKSSYCHLEAALETFKQIIEVRITCSSLGRYCAGPIVPYGGSASGLVHRWVDDRRYTLTERQPFRLDRREGELRSRVPTRGILL